MEELMKEFHKKLVVGVWKINLALTTCHFIEFFG